MTNINLKQQSNERFLIAYRIGAVIGAIGGLFFAFIYISGIFTMGWPLGLTIVIALLSGIPSTTIEVWVATDVVANVFEKITRYLVQNYRAWKYPHIYLKPGQKPIDLGKPQAKKEKWTWALRRQYLLNIFRNFGVVASVLLNATGSGILGWASISAFIIGVIMLAGAGAIALPIVFAAFIFIISICFNLTVVDKRLVSLDPRGYKINYSESTALPKDLEATETPQLASSSSSNPDLKKTTKNKKIEIAAMIFGVMAGIVTGVVTVVAIPGLPFIVPVIIMMLCFIAPPVIVTQVLAAYECFKVWLLAEDYRSTQALIAQNREQLLDEEKKPANELSWFQAWKLYFCDKHPKFSAASVYLSKAFILALKGISTGVFTGICFAGLMIALGSAAPPVGIIIAICIAVAALDMINTYVQNHYVLFKENKDIRVIRDGSPIDELNLDAEDPDIDNKINLLFTSKRKDNLLLRKDAVASPPNLAHKNGLSPPCNVY